MASNTMTSPARKVFPFCIIAALINIAIAVVIMLLLSRSSILFFGADSMYHVYRGDWVLKSVESGDLWPLYNPVWYNGVELMRYWPPLAAYLMAFCQFVARSLPSVFTGSYVFGGFAVYSAVIYLVGSVSWNIVGYVKNRRVMGLIFGVLWFIMPQSIYVLYGEGNLPRSLIMAVFPLAFMFVNEFLKHGGRSNYVGIAVTFFVMCCSHVGYTGMVAIACAIYLVVYRLCCYSGTRRLQRGNLHDLQVLTAIIAGFLLCGVFVLPALRGGLVSNTSNTEQTAVSFFQSLGITLNPVGKFGNASVNYFGIVSFILCLFGIVAGKRRSWPGFITAFLIVLLTSDVCYPVITSLPGGKLMWMLRFLQIAAAMVLYSMLEWKSLKRPLLAFVTVLLFLDSFVSYKMVIRDDDLGRVEDHFELMENDTLIDEAKSLTVNRLAVIDSGRSLFNSTFYLTDYNGSVNQAFGQGWEAASTSGQIARINEAFDNGYYGFMFDRLRELGCDTILVKKDAAAVYMFNQQEADLAASQCLYDKVYDEGNYAVYHLNCVDGVYGTVAGYSGLAIGSGAYYISMMFPGVEEAPSEYIDDFSVETLSSFNVIYLDGFSYHDVEAAESLIVEAAKNGVHVIVLADGIPENSQSRTNRFLGVDCHPVEFDNGFPTLKTRDYGNYEVALFPDEYRHWNTVYMNGLDEVQGWSDILGEQFPFYGTAVNENITFVGFNLTYYYSVTRDETVGRLFNTIVDSSIVSVPDRVFVPLDITYAPNSITVTSPADNVNTSIAVHDMFEGDFRTMNRLVYVDSGTTVINMHYPYMRVSIYLSFLGVVFTAAMAYLVGRKDEE